MARIWYLNTEIIQFTKTLEEDRSYEMLSVFDGMIEFDSETNSHIINGLDTDWNNHTIENGILYRNGQSVIINPTGEEWITREHKENVHARFLISQLKDKSPEEIYVMMQNQMDNWATLADAREDLREWLPLMASVIAWIVMK